VIRIGKIKNLVVRPYNNPADIDRELQEYRDGKIDGVARTTENFRLIYINERARIPSGRETLDRFALSSKVSEWPDAPGFGHIAGQGAKKFQAPGKAEPRAVVALFSCAGPPGSTLEIARGSEVATAVFAFEQVSDEGGTLTTTTESHEHRSLMNGDLVDVRSRDSILEYGDASDMLRGYAACRKSASDDVTTGKFAADVKAVASANATLRLLRAEALVSVCKRYLAMVRQVRGNVKEAEQDLREAEELLEARRNPPTLEFRTNEKGAHLGEVELRLLLGAADRSVLAKMAGPQADQPELWQAAAQIAGDHSAVAGVVDPIRIGKRVSEGTGSVRRCCWMGGTGRSKAAKETFMQRLSKCKAKLDLAAEAIPGTTEAEIAAAAAVVMEATGEEYMSSPLYSMIASICARSKDRATLPARLRELLLPAADSADSNG
jgi:hypothetical protein